MLPAGTAESSDHACWRALKDSTCALTAPQTSPTLTTACLVNIEMRALTFFTTLPMPLAWIKKVHDIVRISTHLYEGVS